MAKIIRENFTLDEYMQMVNEFLYADSRVSLPIESLAKVKDRLRKAATSFRKLFTCYFEPIGNHRFDKLVRRMESLAKRLNKFNADLSKRERKVFILFWKDMAALIEADYNRIGDQYLKNTCNYFIWEISKLK